MIEVRYTAHDGSTVAVDYATPAVIQTRLTEAEKEIAALNGLGQRERMHNLRAERDALRSRLFNVKSEDRTSAEFTMTEAMGAVIGYADSFISDWEDNEGRNDPDCRKARAMYVAAEAGAIHAAACYDRAIGLLQELVARWPEYDDETGADTNISGGGGDMVEWMDTFHARAKEVLAVPGAITPDTLSPRELATQLAALRLWQETTNRMEDPALADIATDGATVEPLTDDEIDALCERLQ